MDTSYDRLTAMDIPEELSKTSTPELQSKLPESRNLKIKTDLPTLIYNFYNLDPRWHASEEVNRVLLLEPKHFQEYPVSEKAVNFTLALGKNIERLQVFVGSFEELKSQLGDSPVSYKEHPLNRHYMGVEEPRDWMFSVKGYHRSFFAFWKKCKKEL